MPYLGIDPDLHCTGVALVGDDGRVVQVWAIKVAPLLRGPRAVCAMASVVAFFGSGLPVLLEQSYTDWHAAVESQEVVRGWTKDPASIVLLATVAGTFVGTLARYPIRIDLPLPKEWKGNVPKEIHHQRIIKKAGVLPEEMPGAAALKKGDWKHVLDAVGLAQWVRERHLTRVKS